MADTNGMRCAPIRSKRRRTITGLPHPRWLIYGGWLGVLGSIFGVIFIPFVLPLLWYLAVAIVGFARARPAGTAEPALGS